MSVIFFIILMPLSSIYVQEILPFFFSTVTTKRRLFFELNAISMVECGVEYICFMTYVCGHFDIKDYDIKQKDTDDIDFNSLLLPGMHTIIAKQSTSQQTCVLDEYKEIRIIPRRRQSPFERPAQSPSRTNSFTKEVTVRDQSACVITGDPKHSQACHIVAIAHWNNEDSLPQSIKNLIYSLPNTINDVRNGLL